MKNSPSVEAIPRVVLDAATAADLMSSNPVSLAASATVKEAAAFFADNDFSAAPVIDEAGRPVGVLSQSDIVRYDREKVEYVSADPEYYALTDLSQCSAEALPTGFEVVDVDSTQVRNIMTPLLFSVLPETAATQVIEDMLAHKIHRLFVVGGDGVLVGIISAIDVLRHLHLAPPSAAVRGAAATESGPGPAVKDPRDGPASKTGRGNPFRKGRVSD
jgi:CBS domain-containing protein